jgi:hypothetical protein
MPDSNTQQEVPTLVRYRTLTDRLDAIDLKIVAATFDIDALAAAGALQGVDLIAVSQSTVEKKAELAAVWRQDTPNIGTVFQGEASSFAHGLATYGSISASSPGSHAWGSAYAGGATIQAGGDGATAFGESGAFGGSIYATGGGSLGFGSVGSGGTISSSGYGSFAAGLARGGGSIATTGGVAVGSAVSSGRIYSDGGFATGTSNGVNSYVAAIGAGTFVAGNAYDGGNMQAYAPGAFSQGFAGTFGTILAEGAGSTAAGFADGYDAAGVITAVGNGASATGWGYGGSITAEGRGSVATGSVNGVNGNPASITTGEYGHGALARGSVRSGSRITALGYGSTAFGASGNYPGVIEAQYDGGVAGGFTGYSGGDILSTDQGAFAFGFTASGTIEAGGAGSLALGYAGGTIKTYAAGAFAGGRSNSGFDISASGRASFAFGDAYSADIVASAAGSVQFGAGTNSLADSVSVGTTVRLKGTTGAPGTPRNGDIWVANNYMYLRTNGVSRKIV